jgi:hypothetical protein
MVRAMIALTVLAGVLMFVMGISEDEVRLRETGVLLSVVLPVIGLLEDRIYRKSRERYLETKAAAERQRAGMPAVTALAPAPAPAAPQTLLPVVTPALGASPWARPTPSAVEPKSSDAGEAIEWYGLYG